MTKQNRGRKQRFCVAIIIATTTRAVVVARSATTRSVAVVARDATTALVTHVIVADPVAPAAVAARTAVAPIAVAARTVVAVRTAVVVAPIVVAARTVVAATVARVVVATAHADVATIVARTTAVVVVVAATQQFSSDLHSQALNQRRTKLIFLQSGLLPKLSDNTSENPRRSHTDPALKIYSSR